jgi:hypothetical protein
VTGAAFFCYLGVMEPTGQQPQQERSLDVTGLPEEAVRALESLVAALRGQPNGRAGYRSHEEWSRALHAWVRGHRALEAVADDSRDSIYAGRGE